MQTKKRRRSFCLQIEEEKVMEAKMTLKLAKESVSAGITFDEGPFVYRLGRKIFILERAVRFCYGLLIFFITDKHL